MVDHVEIIKKQMDDTRSSLADKIEALEDQVTDTVKEATNEVTDTVHSVTDAVTEVTDTVKETVDDVSHTVSEAVQDATHSIAKLFDITGHVRRHPWAGLGGAVFAGFLVGRLIPSRRSESAPEAPSPSSFSTASDRISSFGQTSPTTAAEKPKDDGPQGWFWEELGRLKGLAVSSVMGLVRDLAAHSLPAAIGKKVATEVNRMTSNLGGEPIEEPILAADPDSSSPASSDQNGRKQAYSGRS